MHIEDCLDAIQYVLTHSNESFVTYNLGTRTTTSVNRIADIVSDELGLNPEYEYTGGERGWTGDVPKMRLSIEKLSALGWEPTLSSDQAVRQATNILTGELFGNLGISEKYIHLDQSHHSLVRTATALVSRAGELSRPQFGTG